MTSGLGEKRKATTSAGKKVSKKKVSKKKKGE